MTQLSTYVSEACRLYILIVLAAAVAGKAAARRDFRDTIAELFHLPERAARAAALLVVGAEGLIAVLLLAGGGWGRWAMIAALALFALFTAVILVALVQRRSIMCNCFGGRGHPISFYDVVRNAALIAACGFYLGQGPAAHPLAPAAWLLLAGIALLAFLVSANLNEIALLAYGERRPDGEPEWTSR